MTTSPMWRGFDLTHFIEISLRPISDELTNVHVKPCVTNLCSTKKQSDCYLCIHTREMTLATLTIIEKK